MTERLEDQILQQVLVIQALRLRIARMESIYTTPRAIKSTGMNGTSEDTPHKRDTIVDLGPADVRCVTDQEVERLHKERDDARFRLCKIVGDNREMWADDVAKEYGWSYLNGDGK